MGFGRNNRTFTFSAFLGDNEGSEVSATRGSYGFSDCGDSTVVINGSRGRSFAGPGSTSTPHRGSLE